MLDMERSGGSPSDLTFEFPAGNLEPMLSVLKALRERGINAHLAEDGQAPDADGVGNLRIVIPSGEAERAQEVLYAWMTDGTDVTTSITTRTVVTQIPLRGADAQRAVEEITAKLRVPQTIVISGGDWPPFAMPLLGTVLFGGAFTFIVIMIWESMTSAPHWRGPSYVVFAELASLAASFAYGYWLGRFPPRRTPYCRACGSALQGGTGGRCPDCGRAQVVWWPLALFALVAIAYQVADGCLWGWRATAGHSGPRVVPWYLHCASGFWLCCFVAGSGWIKGYRPNHNIGRCAQCDYDLRGNVSGRCPECGTPVPRVPRIWQTR